MKAILVTVIIALGLSSVAYNQDLPDGPERTCLIARALTEPTLLQCLQEGLSINVTVNTTEEITTYCTECQTTVEPALTQCNLTQLVAMTQQVCGMGTVQTTAGVVMATTESATVEDTNMTTTVGDVMTTSRGVTVNTVTLLAVFLTTVLAFTVY